MRLDKFLKVSRLVKRRTIANELCDARHVTVNGTVARASYEVKLDDVIVLALGPRSVRVKVRSISEYATKENASDLFELLP